MMIAGLCMMTLGLVGSQAVVMGCSLPAALALGTEAALLVTIAYFAGKTVQLIEIAQEENEQSNG